MTKKPETVKEEDLIERKDGLWEHFDEEGNLTKTEEYKDGELVE